MGQTQYKKHLTEADYDKWGKLEINGISNNGQWASYSMTYSNHLDTLFLQHTKRKLLYTFPKGLSGRFVSDDVFAYLRKDSLMVVKLSSGKTQKLPNVKHYEIVAKQGYLLLWYASNLFEVRKLTGEVIEQIKDVCLYKMNESCTSVLYVVDSKSKYEAEVLNFTNYNHIQIARSHHNFESVQWHKEGKSVLLFDGSVLFYYRFSDMKLHTLISDQLKTSGHKFILGSKGQMVISSDGEKVFFTVSTEQANPSQSVKNVEVWNGNDSPILSVKQKIASGKIPKIAVWFPEIGSYEILTDESLSTMRLSGLHDYAVLSNPHSYSLTPKYYEDVDYYLKNISNGSLQLLVQKQSHDPNQLRFSPLNNDLLYYKDKNWWLYKPESNALLNLTQSVKANWDNTSQNAPSQFETYSLAGWSSDGKSVLLYDANDIWKVALDGSGGLRLTKGKEEQKVYRISKTESDTIPIRAFEKEQRILLDLSKPIVLIVRSLTDYSSGYAILNFKSGVVPLCFGNYHVSSIKKSANNCFLYTTETFSVSPQLQFINGRTGAVELLHNSNSQQANYYYGKSELIHYKDLNGLPLKGALYYPADYDLSKKYPMIVHVYEQQSQDVNAYRNPTNFNSEGFNITNFTLNGYFVLLPDINYEIGNPAISANSCVTKAVQTVIDGGMIDSKRIGLIGHSFGGYETNFIVTQSDLFAAAVSGAGVSDTIGYYFNLSANNIHDNELWRFETQQFRMGSSFFENKSGYVNNSPLMQLDKIKTPILLWAGKKDIVIPFNQSETLYLALRRLHHPTILLAYPEENHTLRNRGNEEDLTSRILVWFNYYLKNIKDVSWITDGTTVIK